jgi:hypothetical protein
MSKSIQMVAEIGTQTIRVGTCHPGQARILVKKDHAKWNDGQLILRLRPVHLQVAENNRRLITSEEANEVSNAEVERRLRWLRTIMMAVAETDTHGSDLERIAGPQDADPLVAARHRAQVLQETKGRDAHRIVHSDYLKEGEPWPVPPDLTREEVAEWFNEDEEPGGMNLAEMAAIWDRPNECTWEFYSVLGQTDTRDAPIRMTEPAEVSTATLANVIGADVVEELPVRFALSGKRSKHARWPTYPDEINPQPQSCPSCGAGLDTDGDGDCAVCGPQRVVP